MWELDCEAEHQRIDAFELWCWEKLLRVPWTARRSHQSIIKEISPECSLEGLMLKLKLQYLATWCEELTHWKRPWCWDGLGAGAEGDDRRWDGWMASSTQWTRVGDGQGGLACCNSWDCKQSDTTEWLNWTELMISLPLTLLFWVQSYTPFLCFLSREDPLAFVGELIWWCWILLAFACP